MKKKLFLVGFIVLTILALTSDFTSAEGPQGSSSKTPLQRYLTDPWTATIPDPVTPLWVSGNNHSCDQIQEALNNIYNNIVGIPPPEGGKGTPSNSAEEYAREQYRQAVGMCQAADDFNRNTLAPLSRGYANSHSCRDAQTLNSANQRQCLLNNLCLIQSIYAQRIGDRVDLLHRALESNRRNGRQLGACAEAALRLRWISQRCSIDSSILVTDYTSRFPTYYDPISRTTFPAVSCTAYFSYHADGENYSILTNPSFFEITGQFDIDEFNLRLGRRNLLNDSNIFTDEEIREFDELLSNCRRPLGTECR